MSLRCRHGAYRDKCIECEMNDEFGSSKRTEHSPEAIASWLEGLSRHSACPTEKKYWYQDVASDIRNGAYKSR